RVASALKWGFADSDDVNVRVDKETLTPEDFAKVLELLQYRPLQFCLFLKALVGTEEMQRIMANGIRTAQQGAGENFGPPRSRCATLDRPMAVNAAGPRRRFP